jgi:hypothetical protein
MGNNLMLAKDLLDDVTFLAPCERELKEGVFHLSFRISIFYLQ